MDFYEGGTNMQYFKNIGKLAIVIFLSIFAASQAFAVSSGFYLGLMAGAGTNSGTTQTVQGYVLTPSKGQAMVRIFTGYVIKPYIGLDTGPAYFSTVNYNTKNTLIHGKVQTSFLTWDASIMPMLPFYSFMLYGKVGVAAIYQNFSKGFYFPEPTKSKNSLYASPYLAVGAGYNLNDNWLLDISANRLTTVRKLSSVTYYALGISYHFVDKYCGQFLCDD